MSAYQDVFLGVEKLLNRAAELKERSREEQKAVEWFYAREGTLPKDEVYHGYPGAITEKQIRLGSEFCGRDSYLWLQQRVQVPKKRDGREPMAYFDFGKTMHGATGGFEALLYINGEPYQAVDTNHKEVDLSEFAGQQIELTFLLWTGLEGIVVRKGRHTPYLQHHRLAEAWVGYRNKNIEQLYYYVISMAEAIPCLEEHARDRQYLEQLAEHTLRFLDWDEERLSETCREALDWLDGELSKYEEQKRKEPTVYAVGHTHIDVSWLWRLKHTREKTQRSFSTVLRLMKEYPEYKFLQSQPQLYAYLKQDASQLYEEIKKRVAEGRWEADGGMWLEADCNVTSGESLTRQFLYGIRFIEKEFGRKCTFLWLPDVFGYSWALPQIMKQCGIKTFMTTKISWNQYNTMPNDVFWWKGIDGTDILSYFIDAADPGIDWREKGSTYNGNPTADAVIGTWKKFKNKEITDKVLLAYGFGDGGGGTTREMIERIRVDNRLPGVPNVKPATAGEFFETVHEAVKQAEYVPVWDGELYLEYHRGTYTTQAQNKKQNRKLEYALCETEWLQTLAMLEHGVYDKEKIEESWQTVLRNQFHDIIPGSSIHEVYEDTAREYAVVWAELGRLQETALETLGFVKDGAVTEGMDIQKPLEAWTVLRFADVQGEELVEVPCTQEGVFWNENKNMLPAQKTEKGWLVQTKAEPLGSSQILFEKTEKNITEKTTGEAGSRNTDRNINSKAFFADLESRHLETPYYGVTWEKNGAFCSVYDKVNEREILKGRGNVLRVYEDKPVYYDAWDIEIYYRDKYEDIPAEEISVKENGPLRMKLCFVYRYRKSKIVQNVIFYRNNPRIDFETRVDWQEDHRLLKTIFEVDIRATKASYDIQYGYVERPNHWNTSWDMAKFEVCGHKWADMSETDYGVSLLNDCKYGYAIRDNVMTLSLLKSAKYPDAQADMGMHTFTYALLPHTGAVGKATLEQAILLNQPMKLINGKGKLRRLFEKECENVKIDAVKQAEDGDGIIIRMHECCGGRAKLVLTSEYNLQAFAVCNLLEEYTDKIQAGQIEAAFKPFEIKTFRVWF